MSAGGGGFSTEHVRSGNSYYLPSPMLRPEGSSKEPQTKFLLVTGGVCSSLGKGVTTSALGALLRTMGYRVCAVKIDPYINVDAGLMSPFEHGEVYVLNDGGEVDLDLGNYERWMSISLSRDHNITTGKVYQTLINNERKGLFLGKTAQLVPHFTNEVVERILKVAQLPVDDSGLRPHVCLIELGGTIGDLESAPFVEALRTLRFTLPPEDFNLVHCTYLPVMGGCQKTKPTQHSCRTLLSLGLTADFLVCRSDSPLDEATVKKLSQQCGIQDKYIIGAHNVDCLYDVPSLFAAQGICEKITQKLQLQKLTAMPSLTFPHVGDFAKFATAIRNPKKVVKVAFVGKYVQGGTDAYFSVMQTFDHCSIDLGVQISFLWIDAELLETGESKAETEAALKDCDGIFVPGGFGSRGVNGKIRAAQIARENDIPYLGVCLGFQVALIDIARNVLNLPTANSEEFDKETEHHVIRYMPEIDRSTMGANMRLGAREVNIMKSESILSRIYGGARKVTERHRHRFEMNMNYYDRFQKEAGVSFVGLDEETPTENTRVESIELPSNRFFLAVQYHPEYQTGPTDPSPPYLALIEAASGLTRDWPKNCNSRDSSVRRFK